MQGIITVRSIYTFANQCLEDKTLNQQDRAVSIFLSRYGKNVKITIFGFNEILIENYKNILEYEDIFIKINVFDGTINIHGFNLKLEQMTDEDIKVTGKIDSIDFEEV